MIYFVAFTIIVALSGIIYLSSHSLKLAIALPTLAYVALIAWYVFTAQDNQSVATQAQILFFLGTPMVFFASLLAPYLIEKQRNKGIKE